MFLLLEGNVLFFRFDIVAMFLGNEERKTLVGVFDGLQTWSAKEKGKGGLQQILNLRKKFFPLPKLPRLDGLTR